MMFELGGQKQKILQFDLVLIIIKYSKTVVTLCFFLPHTFPATVENLCVITTSTHLQLHYNEKACLKWLFYQKTYATKIHAIICANHHNIVLKFEEIYLQNQSNQIIAPNHFHCTKTTIYITFWVFPPMFSNSTQIKMSTFSTHSKKLIDCAWTYVSQCLMNNPFWKMLQTFSV